MIIGNEKSNGPASKGKRMYTQSKIPPKQYQGTFSLNYSENQAKAQSKAPVQPQKKADDVYDQFQQIQGQQATNQPKEMVTFDADALQKYYEEQALMDNQYQLHQQQVQQQQKQQQQQQPPAASDDIDDVDQELAKLKLEQEELEKQIAMQMKENEDMDNAIAYQQQMKAQQQQKDLQPLQEKYQQRPSQLASQNILSQQAPSQQSLRQQPQKDVSSNILNSYNQQFDKYEQKQYSSSKRLDNNEGLIGNHVNSDANKPGRKMAQTNTKTTNLLGGNYDYFTDENRLNIDQRKHGHLNKLPQNYDKMAAYQKQQQSHTDQQSKINNRKYQPTNLW